MTAPLLFFDTETTGVPRDPRASIADSANWPHIVQMAWAAFSRPVKGSRPRST